MTTGAERRYDADAYQNAVAIVGMAGRFPGANDLDEYWRNLRDGVESITFFRDDEIEGAPPEALRSPSYVKAKAILDKPDFFDASFFDISANEAQVMDPQHRVLLECAWEALEHAGYGARTGNRAIGIFAGMSVNTYLLLNVASNLDAVAAAGQFATLLGNSHDHLVARIAYKLDLRGPVVTVQTACSTSLAAVHLACQSLLNRECDMALAGAVAITCPLKTGHQYTEGMIFSPDGHCRAFDANAGGTVNGNGVALVVLRRLADALDDGDRIHGIVRGSAMQNDGASKVGYTAPSVDAQARTVAEALAVAQADPSAISYVEAHGSGTPVGDPIEVAALTQAFGGGIYPRPFCALGSVKTNIGHLDVAAGVAGLVKTLLAFRHEQLPPTLHFERPNLSITFAGGPFRVNATLTSWARSDRPRLAAVNSLGVGGTNVHAIVEEPPDRPQVEPSGPQVICLSAKTDTALEAATDRLATHLAQHQEDDFADVAYTLQEGREAMDYRRACVCAERADAIGVLTGRDARRLLTRHRDARLRAGDPSIVFMFPGPGDHYVGMGRAWYERRPRFAEEFDRCAELLRPHLGEDLRDVLFPVGESPARSASNGTTLDFSRMVGRAAASPNGAAGRLHATALLHSALFAVEYALARQWIDWGVKPAAMVGYSIGEYVAACLAGVFSLEDALRVVSTRSRLIASLPPGAMLAVPMSEREVCDVVAGEVAVAAVNTPSMCVPIISSPR